MNQDRTDTMAARWFHPVDSVVAAILFLFLWNLAAYVGSMLLAWFLEPQVHRVTPESVVEGDPGPLVVVGRNLDLYGEVKIGGQTAAVATYVGPHSFNVTVPPGLAPGHYYMTVTNRWHRRVIAPLVFSVEPAAVKTAPPQKRTSHQTEPSLAVLPREEPVRVAFLCSITQVDSAQAASKEAVLSKDMVGSVQILKKLSGKDTSLASVILKATQLKRGKEVSYWCQGVPLTVGKTVYLDRRSKATLLGEPVPILEGAGP